MSLLYYIYFYEIFIFYGMFTQNNDWELYSRQSSGVVTGEGRGVEIVRGPTVDGGDQNPLNCFWIIQIGWRLEGIK